MKRIEFEKEVQERRFQNQLKVQKEVWSLSPTHPTMIKIKNHADRYGIPLEYLIDKLRYGNEDFFLNTFAVDPGRQNIFEELQLKFVRSLPIIKDPQKLPAGGNNAKYIVDGAIVSGSDYNKKGGMKSLDFYWHYDFQEAQIHFYTTTKYTKDDGGAQDNQRQDVIAFLKEARKIEDENIFCIAIIDGDYYIKEREFGSWKEMFNDQYIGDRSFAVESHELPDLIEIILCDWLNSFNCDDAKKEIEIIKNEYKKFKEA